MKKLRYILGMSLLLPAFTFAPVFAEATANNSTDKTATTTATTTAAKTDTTSDPSDHGKKIGEPSTDSIEMGKRLGILKTTLKINLDEATKKRIILKCKPAQTVVQGAEKSDFANGTHRDVIYKKITDAVQNLITRLNTNGVDTTTLAAAETTLEAKVATFNTDMTTYRQALTDLRSLDCATDPAAFQAALTTARADREKVRTDAVDIRTFITTTLKPALEAVKGKLKPATGGTQ